MDPREDVQLLWRVVKMLCGVIVALIIIVVLVYLKAAGAASSAHVAAQQAHHAATRASAVALAVKSDQYQTCLVQSRGLPAGHDLAAAMGDLGKILRLEFKAETPAQESKIPPEDLKLLKDLTNRASQYGKIESKQPKHRSCPKR